jgi:hypothetical protein
MDLILASSFMILCLSFLIYTIISSEKENTYNLLTEELKRFLKVGVAFVLLAITAYLVKTYWWGTLVTVFLT